MHSLKEEVKRVNMYMDTIKEKQLVTDQTI